MNKFKGKAIYQPSGKAEEYARWACNFYVGCSNGCEYCYCKKGILAGAMGQDKPQLKKCFKDDNHAITIFIAELIENLYELQKYGLFSVLRLIQCCQKQKIAPLRRWICVFAMIFLLKFWQSVLIGLNHFYRWLWIAASFVIWKIWLP